MKKSLSEMSLEELWKLFPIILKEHNIDYARWYEEEKENLRQIIGTASIRRISHIGSTAVKELLAKPTIDILLEINEDMDVDIIKESLSQNGWICMSEGVMSEFGLVFNKGYTEAGFADKVFHLHIRYSGDHDELYFRDYLATHPDIASEYAHLKRSLSEKYEYNRDAYTKAKTEFVKKYTAKARTEMGNKYRPE